MFGGGGIAISPSTRPWSECDLLDVRRKKNNNTALDSNSIGAREQPGGAGCNMILYEPIVPIYFSSDGFRRTFGEHTHTHTLTQDWKTIFHSVDDRTWPMWTGSNIIGRRDVIGTGIVSSRITREVLSLGIAYYFVLCGHAVYRVNTDIDATRFRFFFFSLVVIFYSYIRLLTNTFGERKYNNAVFEMNWVHVDSLLISFDLL